MISQQSAEGDVTAAIIIGSSKPETVSLPARGASTGVSAPPSDAAKKGQETSTASGEVLRIDSCGAYPIVVGVPPKSMDVATSTPTGTYRNIQGAGGIFPILDEALELLAKNCPSVTRTVLQFYLLVDGLPAPAPIWPNTKDCDFGVTGSGGSGGWQVQNRVADRLKRQAIDRSQLAAAQQAQARVATQQQEVIAIRLQPVRVGWISRSLRRGLRS
jgi:hypothetical protein